MGDKIYEEGQKLAFIELGKFMVSFEHATHYFKDCISEILALNGLKDTNYSDILLSKLTADPIKTIFQSMIPYHYSGENNPKIEKIIKEFTFLIEIRNIIIHCYWAIGVSPDNPVDLSLIGIKNTTSKKGITYLDLDLELKEIQRISELTEEFTYLLDALSKSIKKGEKDPQEISIEDIGRLDFKQILNKLKQTH